MEPNAISYDMLKTNEGQLNAVFACFGSAAQHAQHFEVALGKFLLVFNKLANQELTLVAFEALDQKLQKQRWERCFVNLESMSGSMMLKLKVA